MPGWKRVLIILLIPFALNLSISMVISAYAVRQAIERGLPPEEIGFEAAKALFTYNFYWSIIQVTLGLYLAGKMGGMKWIKEQFSSEDFTKSKLNSILIIIGLIVFSQLLFIIESYISALSYGGYDKYIEMWNRLVSSLPLLSKVYLVGIAPFTAGIFEEIIWRGYGINMLEKDFDSRKAVLLQAITFGLWHVTPLHVVFTFIVGFVFGYIYVRRRKLLIISIAHILTDIVGFGMAFLR